MMSTIKAERKLLIAGNCDISLDKTRRVKDMSDEAGKQALMVNAATMMNTAKGIWPDYKP